MFEQKTISKTTFDVPNEPHARRPNRQCHAFLQERIQNTVTKGRKKAMCDLERARPKICVHSPKKKVAEESKKDKIIAIPTHLKLNELVIYACFQSEHTDATLNVTQYVRS